MYALIFITVLPIKGSNGELVNTNNSMFITLVLYTDGMKVIIKVQRVNSATNYESTLLVNDDVAYFHEHR